VCNRRVKFWFKILAVGDKFRKIPSVIFLVHVVAIEGRVLVHPELKNRYL